MLDVYSAPRTPSLDPRPPPQQSQLTVRGTLTNLDNQRPTWRNLAHRKLDQAVVAAYGWDPAMSNELLAALLELNHQRAGVERSSLVIAKMPARNLPAERSASAPLRRSPHRWS